MNKDSYLYIGGGLVIMMLAGIFVILLLQVLQPAPALVPTPTLYEFPTTEATASVTPTITASPEPSATNTEQPTNTVIPTPTVDIIATGRAGRENEYLIIYDSLNQTIHETKARFDETFGKLIEGKVSETDEEWQLEIMALLMVYLVQMHQMIDLQPPAEYEQAHGLVVTGITQCADGWEKMFEATQTYDINLYDQGVELVGQCNQNWSQGENMIANLRR